MPRQANDGTPPPLWPEEIGYLLRPRLEKTFPPELVPLLLENTTRFAPQPSPHPPSVAIKRVNDTSHPAHGQRCLVAKKAIRANELIIPYLGEIHATFTPAEPDCKPPPSQPSHEDSDYDLSLIRLSSSDSRNPFPGFHVSIGVDAAVIGNAARFVNDYRGIGKAPNAEFRLGRGPGGEVRMEIWSGRNGVVKGEELLVSYGKGWWGARQGGTI